MGLDDENYYFIFRVRKLLEEDFGVESLTCK